MKTRPSRTSGLTVLLFALLLMPVLGGGCTFAFHSNTHDGQDDHNQGGGTVIITSMTDDDPDAGAGGSPVAATPEAASAQQAAGLVVVLQDMPDADGDGVPELALLLVAPAAHASEPGDLDAEAFVLSGQDGRVLGQQTSGDDAGARARVSVTPLPAKR